MAGNGGDGEGIERGIGDQNVETRDVPHCSHAPVFGGDAGAVAVEPESVKRGFCEEYAAGALADVTDGVQGDTHGISGRRAPRCR